MKKTQVIPEFSKNNRIEKLILMLLVDDNEVRTTRCEFDSEIKLSCKSTSISTDLDKFLLVYSHDINFCGVVDDRDGIIKLIKCDVIDKWKQIYPTISSERLQQAIIDFLINREMSISNFL